MFSPSFVRIVATPWACCAAAAPIASSSRSPGMKVDTDRRTNAVFMARSRSHALVDIASKTLRAMLIERMSQKPFDEAAVDLHRGAGDVRSGFREQKSADAAEFVRRPVTPHRDRSGGLLLLIFDGDSRLLRVDLVEVAQAIRGDAARHQCVHANPVWSQLTRQRLRQRR